MCTQDPICTQFTTQFTQQAITQAWKIISYHGKEFLQDGSSGVIANSQFGTQDGKRCIEDDGNNQGMARSPLAELNGGLTVHARAECVSNAGTLNGDAPEINCCSPVPDHGLPDIPMSVCTPMTPRTSKRGDPVAATMLSPCTAPDVDASLWRGEASEHPADMAMSMCTPMTPTAATEDKHDMAMSMCTQMTSTAVTEDKHDMAVSPCTQPAKFGSDVDDMFKQPAVLLQTIALQVAEVEAQRVFGWARLRLFQKCAIEAWAAGKHCFLLSGTGSGKTGCFVLPALVARHWHQRQGSAVRGPPPIALVVSPLVALMRDQARRLQVHGVPAAVHSPQVDDPQAWQRTLSGEIVVCYMSPELLFRYANNGQLTRLPRVSLLAIDEAHCVSEWGFHFRPEYGELRRVIAGVAKAGYGGRAPPVLCVTATCTAEVRDDVIRSLELDPVRTDFVTGTMNRPNIFYAVEELPNRERMRRRLLEMFGVAAVDQTAAQNRRTVALDLDAPNIHSPTIIYAQKKNDCDQLARLLESGGVRAAAFHSSLSQDTKEQVQEAFHHGRLQVVVATVAFGMGIDKSDVRRVIHFGLPKSLEAYTQESGRAGRDGNHARCTILYNAADRSHTESAILGENPVPSPSLKRSLMRLQHTYHFCRERRRCRRAQLLEYLGENLYDKSAIVSSQPAPSTGTLGFCTVMAEGDPWCGRCDLCCSSSLVPAQDVSAELLALLQYASSASLCARTQLVEMAHKSPNFTLKKEAWSRIVDAAVHQGFLEVLCAHGKSYAVHAITGRGKMRLAAGRISEQCLVDVGMAAQARPAAHVLQLPSWLRPGANAERCLQDGEILDDAPAVVGQRPVADETELESHGVPKHPQFRRAQSSRTWFTSAVNWHDREISHDLSDGPVQEQVVERDAQEPRCQAGSSGRARMPAGGPSGQNRTPLDAPIVVGTREPSKRTMCEEEQGGSRPLRRLRRSGSSGQPPEPNGRLSAASHLGEPLGAVASADIQAPKRHCEATRGRMQHPVAVFFKQFSRSGSSDRLDGLQQEAGTATRKRCAISVPDSDDEIDSTAAVPATAPRHTARNHTADLQQNSNQMGAMERQSSNIPLQDELQHEIEHNLAALVDAQPSISMAGPAQDSRAYQQVDPFQTSSCQNRGQKSSPQHVSPPSNANQSRPFSAHGPPPLLNKSDQHRLSLAQGAPLQNGSGNGRSSLAQSSTSPRDGANRSRSSCAQVPLPLNNGNQASSSFAQNNANQSRTNSAQNRPANGNSGHSSSAQGGPPRIRPTLRRSSSARTPSQSSANQSRSQKTGRRTRKYTAEDKSSTTPFIAKLMEAADFNSNKKGGVADWKRLMQDALSLAPPEHHQGVHDVIRIFDSKYMYVHGYKLDELIDSLGFRRHC